MKKALVLFGIIAIAPLAASAYMYENETTEIKTIEAQGYSSSMQEIVDWSNYRGQGVNGTYVRHFQHKKKNKLGRAYQRLKEYWDPIQDDGEFGDRHIEFSNTWMGNDTKYSSDMVENKQVENL